MIKAALVITPTIDKATFHNVAESVTVHNYLRDTDAKNLRGSAEVKSILDDFARPFDAGNLIYIGFMFAGTIDLVSKIPSIVNGTFATNQETTSSMLASTLVMATLNEWQAACFKAQNSPLAQCFDSISDQLKSFQRANQLKISCKQS